VLNIGEELMKKSLSLFEAFIECTPPHSENRGYAYD